MFRDSWSAMQPLRAVPHAAVFDYLMLVLTTSFNRAQTQRICRTAGKLRGRQLVLRAGRKRRPELVGEGVVRQRRLVDDVGPAEAAQSWAAESRGRVRAHAEAEQRQRVVDAVER